MEGRTSDNHHYRGGVEVPAVACRGEVYLAFYELEYLPLAVVAANNYKPTFSVVTLARQALYRQTQAHEIRASYGHQFWCHVHGTAAYCAPDLLHPLHWPQSSDHPLPLPLPHENYTVRAVVPPVHERRPRGDAS